MMWKKWMLWTLMLGIIISIIIALVGLTQSNATWNGMFGGGVVSALVLQATITFMQVWKWSMMKKQNQE